MRLEYDFQKSERNRIERSLPFDRAVDFDWENAIYYEDKRCCYPEKRIIARSYLDGRLHMLCFTLAKDGVRIISFRKANSREVKQHEKNIKTMDK